MRVYGNSGSMPHTAPRPIPLADSKKYPPKATALGADLLKAPGHIDHIGKKRGPRAKVVPPKTCLQCGSEFTRRDGERLNSFTLRATCSATCANILRQAARR